MIPIEAIKPGPKPKKEDGSDDKRRRVNPENKPKHVWNGSQINNVYCML